MDTSYFSTLFDYNYWANGRVLAAARQVTAAQLVEPAGLSHGSLRGALAHVLGAEIVWRLRCQEGVSVRALFGEADFGDLAQMAERWSAEAAAMRRYLGGLGEADLTRSISYQDTRGAHHETPLWQILAHVVNHGSQFRAEAGVALAHFGHSPGDLDMIVFFRQMGS